MNTILKAHTTETVDINGTTYKTYTWLLQKEEGLTSEQKHHMFYRQFCTPAVLAIVRASFNPAQWEKLAKAYARGNAYLNDCIPITHWDRIEVKQLVGRLLTECKYKGVPRGTFYWSPSDNVCIVKEAAALLIESNQYPHDGE